VNAVKLAAVTVAVLLAAHMTGWSLLDHLFYALAGLGLLAFAWSLSSLHGVRLSRRPAMERGQVGQVFAEHLHLENDSPLGKIWIEVEDHSTLPGHRANRVTALAGRGRSTWTVSTQLTHRGRYRLGPARLRAGDPFGLFPVERLVGGTAEILVYPTVVPLPETALPGGDLAGDSRTHRRTPHVSPTAGGVRDYVPGDGLNRIAWAHSARLGRLIAKEFEQDPAADTWLVLDMDRSVHYGADDAPSGAPPEDPWRRSTAEFCIVVAASLATHFLDQKRAVGLLAAGQHHEVIPTDRGPRQVTKMLEALSALQPTGISDLGEVLTAEAARFRRTSTLLIVTPTTDDRWTPALAALVRAGIQASAVLIDAGTFGGPESPLLLVGQLATVRVPTVVLNRGDNLAVALRQLDGNQPAASAPRRREAP
jgi:uncharacterized protein (DUF58 family)